MKRLLVLLFIRSLFLAFLYSILPSANGSFEAAAISLNYEGTRVKSALIGRDLNPMGRGDGVYYFAGAMRTSATLLNIGYNHNTGTGNSVNNCGQNSGLGNTSVTTEKKDDKKEKHKDSNLPKPKEVNYIRPMTCAEAKAFYESEIDGCIEDRKLAAIRHGEAQRKVDIHYARLIDAALTAIAIALAVLANYFGALLIDIYWTKGTPAIPAGKGGWWKYWDNIKEKVVSTVKSMALIAPIITARNIMSDYCMLKQSYESASFMAFELPEWMADLDQEYCMVSACNWYKQMSKQLGCGNPSCVIIRADRTPPEIEDVYTPCMEAFDKAVAEN